MSLLEPNNETLNTPIEAVGVGDQLMVGGEWLTVERIQLSPDGGRYVFTDDGRAFQARPKAQRRARGGAA